MEENSLNSQRKGNEQLESEKMLSNNDLNKEEDVGQEDFHLFF